MIMHHFEKEWSNKKLTPYRNIPPSAQKLHEKQRMPDDPQDSNKKTNKTINRRTVDYNSVIMRYIQVQTRDLFFK